MRKGYTSIDRSKAEWGWVVTSFGASSCIVSPNAKAAASIQRRRIRSPRRQRKVRLFACFVSWFWNWIRVTSWQWKSHRVMMQLLVVRMLHLYLSRVFFFIHPSIQTTCDSIAFYIFVVFRVSSVNCVPFDLIVVGGRGERKKLYAFFLVPLSFSNCLSVFQWLWKDDQEFQTGVRPRYVLFLV